jgi:hypothetical protein
MSRAKTQRRKGEEEIEDRVVGGRVSGVRAQRLFFLKKIPQDFIDVFSMTNVMDLDDMVLVVNFINNPKPSHS